MRRPKSKGKRAAAAALGILLVLALLTGLSTVTGNPLVAAVGARRAARYAADVRGVADAEVSAPQKDRAGNLTYWYTVSSAHSPDTTFLVEVPLVGEITDNYEYAVTQLHNTRDRLGREMAAAAMDALDGTPYGALAEQCAVVYGYLPPSEPETFPEIPFREAFSLDMPFDAEAVAVPTLLELRLVGEEASEEALNRALSEVKAAMEQSRLCFDYYTVSYERPDASYGVGDFSGMYRAEAVPRDAIA